ncbi:MAG: hypothetical protein LBU32_20715 [Clostridiales bacterium]|nr:hypothetical protein [Clostridiales bacterium]
MQAQRGRPRVSRPAAVRARGDQGAFKGRGPAAIAARIGRDKGAATVGWRFGGEIRAFLRDGRGSIWKEPRKQSTRAENRRMPGLIRICEAGAGGEARPLRQGALQLHRSRAYAD